MTLTHAHRSYNQLFIRTWETYQCSTDILINDTNDDQSNQHDQLKAVKMALLLMLQAPSFATRNAVESESENKGKEEKEIV